MSNHIRMTKSQNLNLKSNNKIFSFEELFPLEPYAKFIAEDWMARILKSEVYREYPSAQIDFHYVNQLGDRFDHAVLQQRADILLQEVKEAGYDRGNFTEYAIVDVAKARKINHFLKNQKFRMKIITKIKSKL